MSPVSLREHLRAGTSEIHALLDAQVAARGYLQSAAGYRDLLLRTLSFQSGAEHALATLGAQDWIPDWARRVRTPLLLEDLRASQVDDDALHRAMTAGREVAASLTGPRSRERVFGIAYVLEGSTLGSAQVLRQLPALGITDAGAAFLMSGKLPERRWPDFLARLEAQDDAGFDRHIALQAAHATFSAARQRLV